MRGLDPVCNVSDAWSWSGICPEVKAGLSECHPPITNFTQKFHTEGNRSSHLFPGPSQWLEAIEGVGHGAKGAVRTTVTHSTKPVVLTLPKQLQGQVTQDLRQSSNHPRMPFYTTPAEWLNTEGKRSEHTMTFPRSADQLLENTCKSKCYIDFEWAFSGNSFCVKKTNHSWSCF